MTKGEFTELFQYRLVGGPLTGDYLSKYHSEYVIRFLSPAYEIFMNELAKRPGINLDIYAKSFLQVDVLYNEDEDFYYSTSPAPYLSISCRGQSGVQRIRTMKGKGVVFVPIQDDDAADVLDNLLKGIDNEIWWNVFGMIIKYQPSNIVREIKKVKMDIMLPLSEMAEDDQIFIPDGAYELIFETAINLMNSPGVEDKITDNNTHELQ